MSSHSKKISKALRSTAYHEAGHAVCNYHSGMKLGTILVDEDIGEVSRTPLLNEDDVAAFWRSKFSGQNTTHESRRELVDRQAVSWLAGPMAEKEFNPDYDPEASDSDYEAVENLELEWDIKDWASWNDQIRSKATKFVKDHWGGDYCSR